MNQISPLAYVHPEAKLGDNNIIGPFCYIDKNVEIGDNNEPKKKVGLSLSRSRMNYASLSILQSSRPKDRISLSQPTLLTTTPMCFWRISLTITKTTTRITKPTCGLAKTDTDITVRHTT